ncbi:MAG: hypothetical protein IJO32_06635 [Bacilli bacterium]|nr:hypothetical protein [Bacilli bacterium]
MRKEYLEPLETSDNSKTLKFLKSIYKSVNENPNKFQNNEQIKRIIKSTKKEGK